MRILSVGSGERRPLSFGNHSCQGFRNSSSDRCRQNAAALYLIVGRPPRAENSSPLALTESDSTCDAGEPAIETEEPILAVAPPDSLTCRANSTGVSVPSINVEPPRSIRGTFCKQWCSRFCPKPSEPDPERVMPWRHVSYARPPRFLWRFLSCLAHARRWRLSPRLGKPSYSTPGGASNPETRMACVTRWITPTFGPGWCPAATPTCQPTPVTTGPTEILARTYPTSKTRSTTAPGGRWICRTIGPSRGLSFRIFRAPRVSSVTGAPLGTGNIFGWNPEKKADVFFCRLTVPCLMRPCG